MSEAVIIKDKAALGYGEVKAQSWKLKALAAAVLGSTLLFSGCATKPTYQAASPNIVVDERGVPNLYKVKTGDTVSQIAARYGLNYRQIGALNGLDRKYTIYSGQWLKLWEGHRTAATRVSTSRSSNTSVTRTQPTRTANPVSQPSGVEATKGFGYPTNNPVVKNYDANAGEMSMWFSGRVGDPVVASKGGNVLYAGNGLPEYGNLVMIRHDSTYITVYAHNDKLLVKEGDQVKAGQRIATMGSTGQTNQVGLQFQLRENGNPVDPRAVLGF